MQTKVIAANVTNCMCFYVFIVRMLIAFVYLEIMFCISSLCASKFHNSIHTQLPVGP